MAKALRFRPLLAAAALAASVAAAPGAQAAGSYVRHGDVERDPASEVARILLDGVADKTVEVAWDDVDWRGGLHRQPLLLIGKPRAEGSVAGLCRVPVTEVEVFTEARSTKPTPGRPRDALRVSTLKTTYRYLIVGRLAEQEAPADEAPCRDAPRSARHAFVSPLAFWDLVRSATALQRLLESARANTLVSPVRCIDATMAPGSCTTPGQTLAVLDARNLRWIQADPERPGSFTAIVADSKEQLWDVTFDTPGRDAPPSEVVIEREVRLVLTGDR